MGRLRRAILLGFREGSAGGGQDGRAPRTVAERGDTQAQVNFAPGAGRRGLTVATATLGPVSNEMQPQPALSDQQQEAIGLLVARRPVTEIAEHLGVSRVTVWRWGRHRDFSAALDGRRRELEEATSAKLLALRVKALDRLGTLLDDPNTRTQLLASQVVLRASSNAQQGRDDPGKLLPPAFTGEVAIPVPPELDTAERETVRSLVFLLQKEVRIRAEKAQAARLGPAVVADV